MTISWGWSRFPRSWRRNYWEKPVRESWGCIGDLSCGIAQGQVLVKLKQNEGNARETGRRGEERRGVVCAPSWFIHPRSWKPCSHLRTTENAIAIKPANILRVMGPCCPRTKHTTMFVIMCIYAEIVFVICTPESWGMIILERVLETENRLNLSLWGRFHVCICEIGDIWYDIRTYCPQYHNSRAPKHCKSCLYCMHLLWFYAPTSVEIDPRFMWKGVFLTHVNSLYPLRVKFLLRIGPKYIYIML